jgi:hypothetical protein
MKKEIILVIFMALILLGAFVFLDVNVRESHVSCCTCPGVSCSGINERTRQVRVALDMAVPGKWFLVEGTLIAALRWGEHCHDFKSGKKNFVDGDMDVYIVAEKSKVSNVMSDIENVLKRDGWSKPKDRGDGIFVTESPLRVPKYMCGEGKETIPFYMDIHVMHPVPGGFDVGEMRHLWVAFLRDGILPYDIIYPLAKCSWGGGIAGAPSEYQEILANWNGNEYGSFSGMWKPLEQCLATGDWFECKCNLASGDIAEIRESIRGLQGRGLVSFDIPKIVVSLTTIPPRLPKLEKVLRALTTQAVDVVYLNLPYVCTKTGTKYDPLPEFLKGMDKLTIRRCEDYGPLTKLLPTLENELDPSTVIIICDDDMLYQGRGWALELAAAVDSTTAASYATWEDDGLTILMGYKGFAFQREAFAPGYLEFFSSLSRACRFGDDYSISYYLKKKGVKVVEIREQPDDIVDLEHHGMPEFSLKEGAPLTQGNEANYKQCKKDLK